MSELVRLTPRETAEISAASRRHTIKVVFKWNPDETTDLVDPPQWAKDWLAKRRSR
jgi:hypothetical protein